MKKSIYAVCKVNRMSSNLTKSDSIKETAAIYLLCFSLALIALALHVMVLGTTYIEEGNQVKRHYQLLAGVAPSPWQYRILSDVLVTQIRPIAACVSTEFSHLYSFCAVRLFFATGWLILLYAFYRNLQYSKSLSIVGILIAGFASSLSIYDSDLSLNIYGDLFAYGIGFLLLHNNKERYFPFLIFIATLNRETAAGLLIILFCHYAVNENISFSHIPRVFTFSSIAFLTAFLIPRLTLGAREIYAPYNINPGIELLSYNFTSIYTLLELWKVFGPSWIPAFMGFSNTNKHIRLCICTLGILWVIVHLFFAVVAETRVLLVPYSFLIIPCILSAFSTKELED